MPKLKGVIEYNGNAFEGFQRQKHTAQTVAGVIEEALKRLNIKSQIVGSGRTDAGVHAANQVIDFEVPSYWSDTQRLQNALNHQLKAIRFKHLIEVNSSFHSRFHAKRRIYRYIFKTTTPNVFEKDFVAYYDDFNSDKLKEALGYFQGEHDFSLLCKSGSITHTNIRTIYKAAYKKRNNYHFI
ncbi:MAG: tRNA pseudouridine(38-40) synthase TruA, partial [Campylobacterales bacterium]|nr:tRNA pseudouridine(38-40) synthase TruA [Campylobacterales bacterium]